jgi:hypothetical protein
MDGYLPRSGDIRTRPTGPAREETVADVVEIVLTERLLQA